MKFFFFQASKRGAEQRFFSSLLELPYLWTADNEVVSVSWKRAAESDRSICPQRIAISSRQTAAEGSVRYILNSFRFNVSIKRGSKRKGLEPHNKGKCGEKSLLNSRALLIPLIPAKTVAMATVAREVCSIDKSATEDEGVDRSFWRSLIPFAEGPWSRFRN